MIWVSFNIAYLTVCLILFAVRLYQRLGVGYIAVPLLLIPLASLIAPTDIGYTLGFMFYFVVGLTVYLSYSLLKRHNAGIWVRTILLSGTILCSLTGLEVLLYECSLLDVTPIYSVYSQIMAFLQVSLLLNFIVGDKIAGSNSHKPTHSTGDDRSVTAWSRSSHRDQGYFKIEGK